MMTMTTTNEKIHVVGIGSSAGGLEALIQLVAGLSPKLNCVYVIAQHMSPNHRSMMVDILSRETHIPIAEIQGGETPTPDVVYIIPPGSNLVFKQGKFHLTATSPEISPKPSINLMFQSMAEEFDEYSVGIILSGTGSDGTSGLKAIKSVGGVTFVQIPETAKYDGMPRSAIDACVADKIISPDQIGRELERLLNFPDAVLELENGEQRPAELAYLFEKVRLHTRIDFSSYKLATVQRRLLRRMMATEASTLNEYLAIIENNPSELDALAKETLISVTEFFRDKDAFRTLERFVTELVERKKENEEIRVWVVGCATGEEAYSIAILFLEQIAAKGQGQTLQVFATDIDNDALNVGRRAIYNKSAMVDVPVEYKEKYFIPSGNGFEPTKFLRDSVTFARQDISVDPPFMRIDLVTCRNVMIYFNNELQAKVLSVFRYSLRDDGLLFLGRSETVGQQEGMFSPVDRRSRIYRPRGESKPVKMGKLLKGKLSIAPSNANFTPEKIYEKTHEKKFLKAIADHFSPAILIDANCKILHSHGDVTRFVHFPLGVPDMNLAHLIVSEFTNEILTTLYRVQKKQNTCYSRKRRIATIHNEVWRLVISPVENHAENELFLVTFETFAKHAKTENTSDDVQSVDPYLNDELISTREHLQTLMEEMASSNEEMQALNEEIQAANEELQASNEELEASNEELQATNEELVSVNEESQIKSAELASINSDFESVYDTIDFPILVFDTDLFLKRANGAAIHTYDLPPMATGQNISRLKLPKFLNGIEVIMSEVITEQHKKNYRTNFESRTYQVFITPTLSLTGVTQSVVLVIVDNTDLVAAQEQIVRSEQRLLSIMNHSVSMVSLKDVSGRYEFVNHCFENLFHVKACDVIGKTDKQLFGNEISTLLRKRDLSVLGQMDIVESIEELTLASETLWLQAIRFPIFDKEGVISGICTQATDVTKTRHAEEQLRLAAKVFDRAGEAILITDPKGHIITVNDSFTTVTGYTLQEVIGKNPSILSSGKHSSDFYKDLWRSLVEHGSWQGEIYNKRKNGEDFPEWLTINSVLDEDGSILNYVAIFSDITAIKSSQRRIEFMATHDELTGIPNRSLLLDRLKHTLVQAKRQNQTIAVFFIDLDNFKNINDSLGHDVGDLLLKEATQRLKGCIRDMDTLARLGGDEFVTMLVDVSLEKINAIATRMIDSLAASFQIADSTLFVSGSIGISLFPNDGEDSVTLLKNADTAMYRSKENGRNQYQFFEEEMKVVNFQRMTFETGLRVAIDSDHFSVHYQPQIDIRTGKMVGAEALLRWHSPHLGHVSPADFIPIAESCGLIGKIGDIVFDKVLNQIKTWQLAGLEVPCISINVSSHQLKGDTFLSSVAERLAKIGVKSTQICLEITESVLLNDINAVQKSLKELEQMGIGISIDDFGTGYSSLAYLKKLPLHELKIDKSFVDEVDTNSDDYAIAKAIIQMAQALGFHVVAEGVETESQFNVLKDLGCDIVQGYYFHRPLQADGFVKLLTNI
jgi:two-component system CheB/CheR fusion protein